MAFVAQRRDGRSKVPLESSVRVDGPHKLAPKSRNGRCDGVDGDQCEGKRDRRGDERRGGDRDVGVGLSSDEFGPVHDAGGEKGKAENIPGRRLKHEKQGQRSERCE